MVEVIDCIAFDDMFGVDSYKCEEECENGFQLITYNYQYDLYMFFSMITAGRISGSIPGPLTTLNSVREKMNNGA